MKKKSPKIYVEQTGHSASVKFRNGVPQSRDFWGAKASKPCSKARQPASALCPACSWTKFVMKHGSLIISFFMCFIAAGLFAAPDAWAMHISEGILPFNWAVLWFAVAAPFVAGGLYRLAKRSKTDLSFKPLVGLMAAAIFIISCMPIPVPTAGTCSHPCGTGMSAILLGPSISVLVAAVALLIQALFLAHGGLSTWGANIVSMGVMGSFTGYATFKVLRSARLNMAVAGFIAGLFADWATYAGTSAILAAGIKGDDPFMPLFGKILVSFIPTQLPLGILEGAITAGMIVLLYKKRPDLLVKMHVITASEGLRAKG